MKSPEDGSVEWERYVRELVEGRQRSVELAELNAPLLEVLPVIGPGRFGTRFFLSFCALLSSNGMSRTTARASGYRPRRLSRPNLCTSEGHGAISVKSRCASRSMPASSTWVDTTMRPAVETALVTRSSSRARSHGRNRE
jgi:hypothetical protein